jgi:hypothetical protein
LREAAIDDVKRRGLVLHHHAQTASQTAAAPQWIGSELLRRIDQMPGAAAPPVAPSMPILIEYADEAITGGRRFRGAMMPVIDRRADEQIVDTRWLVLVQEPASR